jgi:hypothetical protein
MTETMYQKLLCQFQALTPMCHFESPEVLCTDEELFYRRIHERADKALTKLVNLEIEKIGGEAV